MRLFERSELSGAAPADRAIDFPAHLHQTIANCVGECSQHLAFRYGEPPGQPPRVEARVRLVRQQEVLVQTGKSLLIAAYLHVITSLTSVNERSRFD